MSYDEHLISQAGGDGDMLDQIQRRADSATPGPWDMAISEDRKWALVLANPGTGDEYRVARASDDDDAEFIAHARMDVPYLLALVREQAAKLEAVRELADAAPTFAGFVDTGSVPVADLRAALEPTP